MIMGLFFDVCTVLYLLAGSSSAMWGPNTCSCARVRYRTDILATIWLDVQGFGLRRLKPCKTFC